MSEGVSETGTASSVLQAHQTLVKTDAVVRIKAEIVSMGGVVAEFLAADVPGAVYKGTQRLARPGCVMI
jgi:hypothetical protein